MNETDEELREIFETRNGNAALDFLRQSTQEQIFAAMRLAMEKVRKEQKEDAERWRKFASSPQTALMLGSKLDPNEQHDWVAECNALVNAATSSSNETGEKDNGGFNSGDLMAAMMRDGVGS